jgi:hypothetical protein
LAVLAVLVMTERGSWFVAARYRDLTDLRTMTPTLLRKFCVDEKKPRKRQM